MIKLLEITRHKVVIGWQPVEGAESYRVYWSDRNTEFTEYRLMREVKSEEDLTYTLIRSTAIPHYLKVAAVQNGVETECFTYCTPVHYVKQEQLEKLNRGLIALKQQEGIFLSWRLLLSEVVGYNPDGTGLTGVFFIVCRNGIRIAKVENSTNYLDKEGEESSVYTVIPVLGEREYPASEGISVWQNEYLDIPLKKPAGGVTPAGESYEYSANDMSVADVDGDGEYEYLVKWDPDNSHDVSIKGYTGLCYLDCYKLDGRLLWRLNMGENIRAGAHYTQFMCCDFNGDGKAEMAVKTAPGTKMTIYKEDGTVKEEYFVTMPKEDQEAGYSHEDSYVCSAKDYELHIKALFLNWLEQPEVKSGQWPGTLEECFGIDPVYSYPLCEKDAGALTDFFLDIYAPGRSSKNKLREFEGFIYQGLEYLTMFGGDGCEIQTIPFPFERIDDGLRWGDYSMNRIEPCNRSDRFLSGVAYLDGKRPYLVLCRGYYTRSAIAAYSFFDDSFKLYWSVDSGFVPMSNPFADNPHEQEGADPVYGKLAGQGNHSLSTADVDGDGCMEIIYGGACIDHDGSLLYSSYDNLPDGRRAKLGHGDAMHVADIDPDRPGLEIFNVFEGAECAPYGYALRDAETGYVLFGEYAEADLGRCMIGDMIPGVRGLQCWVNNTGLYDCKGNLLAKETPGSNMSIRWAADLSTQITDGVDYLGQKATGVINDRRHGIMLQPKGTLTNNGTKGNPCLVADILGDFREEILLRTEDSTAIRIYTNTEITDHKLFTLMHDSQYRCGVAWQNNCYNQPGYTSFYYGSDMDFHQVLPEMNAKPVIYIAGDSTAQSYSKDSRPQYGWGEMLLANLFPEDCIAASHRPDCEFDQELRYENRHLIVDNCAMAGRSSKTFREEGRLKDIDRHIKEGDYLLIQFGHNDASTSKKERYVPVEEFAQSLEYYIETARKHGAVPVLVSSIALRPCAETDMGEKGEIKKLLPDYAKVMERLAAEEDGIIYIDMGALTVEACKQVGEENTRLWYKEDNVHLVEAGADIYGKLLAEQMKGLIIDFESK